MTNFAYFDFAPQGVPITLDPSQDRPPPKWVTIKDLAKEILANRLDPLLVACQSFRGSPSKNQKGNLAKDQTRYFTWTTFAAYRLCCSRDDCWSWLEIPNGRKGKRAARVVFGLLIIALAACTDRQADAEKRYEVISRTGTISEVCATSKAIAREYLASGDEKNFKHWQSIYDNDCFAARILGDNYPVPGGAMYTQLKDEAGAAAQAAVDAANTMTKRR